MKHSMFIYARDLMKDDWIKVGGEFARIKKLKKQKDGVAIYLVDVNRKFFAVLVMKKNKSLKIYNQ